MIASKQRATLRNRVAMKAYEIEQPTGIEGLVLNTKRPVPEAGPGEIKVQVRATSLNYRDLLVARGAYRGALKPSLIPLSDGAGEVVDVGPGVSRFKLGDRVVGVFFQGWTAGVVTAEATARALGGAIDGMLAEYVILPELGAIRVPAHLTDEQAATLPCAALTAWNAIVEMGRIKAGETVLLLGTGGVSLFALQFAKLHGARVILTSSSDEKLARAKSLGADNVINYRNTPDWDKTVNALTEGRGADLVVEVGGPGTLERSIRSTRVGGTIAMIGVVTGAGQVDPRPLISRAIRLQGIYVGSLEMFRAMNAAITQAALLPIIDRVFPFEEAHHAYAHLLEKAHFGKVVIAV
jgi:NADPH:quinone reductase-like Zn-dependent oxidoreductase